MRSLDELLHAAKGWHDWLRGAVLPGPLAESLGAEPSLEALRNLGRRIHEGNQAPLRIALFGPTGAGKSKIFNSLVREPLSPASYRRPCTRRPVYYVHERHGEIARGLAGDVRLHGRPGWEGRILIDAPDFDSVEAENRALASRIYLEADAFVFVADVHKYADASAWSYLERIRAEGKACAFVLNKFTGAAVTAGDDPLEDFRARLERFFGERGLPGPLIGIAELPQGDEDLLPEDEPGFREIAAALERFQSRGRDGVSDILAGSFRTDLRRFLHEWDRLAGPLVEYRGGIRRLLEEIEGIYEKEAASLERDVQAEVDPELKGDVYREVLRRIEKIDVLRYPRRLLGLPLQGLKFLLGGLWGKLRGARGGGEEVRAASEALNLALLQGHIGSLEDAARKAMAAEKACPGLAGEDLQRSLRLDRGALKDRFRRKVEEFRAWAEGEARATASALTTENKAKFILSQVIYNAVVIGVQVKTAGTLTLTELFTDGILSPLVAKAVGMAVSNEKVLEFERRARKEFARRLAEILREAKDRYAGHLASSAAGIDGIEGILGQIEDLRASQDALRESFLGRCSG